MIDIPVEDLVFVVCTLVGGGLLLVTVLVDDILGAIFDFDIGGVSLMPLLLSFVSMFGVGGLFATQVLDVHGGQAAIIGSGFGLAGLAVVYVLFSSLAEAEAAEPFSTATSSATTPSVRRDPRRPLRQRPGQGGGPDPRVQRHTTRSRSRPGDGPRDRHGRHRPDRGTRPSGECDPRRPTPTREGPRVPDVLEFIGGGRARRLPDHRHRRPASSATSAAATRSPGANEALIVSGRATRDRTAAGTSRSCAAGASSSCRCSTRSASSS